MQPTRRSFRANEDIRLIREFLRECYLLNNRHEFCWSVLRWDYWIGHVNMNIYHFDLKEVVTIWEADGKIAAVSNPDGSGEAFLQVHPLFYSDSLYREMLEIVQRPPIIQNVSGKESLLVWVGANDSDRKKILEQTGFQRSKFLAEHMRRRDYCLPIPETHLPDGYIIRSLGGESEHPARSWLSWKVFHPDEPDEKYHGWEWYKNVQNTPMYQRDLDIVAVAQDGELAAFCTVWYDELTQTAVFEPVGTHPAHKKRGLGKSVMAEGLRRAHQKGATLATVSSYSAAAHALYESMGFTDLDISEPWVKEW
jgi:mycothiol synthase